MQYALRCPEAQFFPELHGFIRKAAQKEKDKQAHVNNNISPVAGNCLIYIVAANLIILNKNRFSEAKKN